jgi:O-antigen ligase
MNPHSLSAWTAACCLAASMFAHTVALRLILLAATGVLVSLAAAQERPELRLLPPIWLPFALWALWAGLSVAWSADAIRSIKEYRSEIGYAALTLWSCFVAAQARGSPRVVLPVTALAAAAACGIALQTYSAGWERYMEGLHGGPGDHSSALLTLMPCALMAGWYGWRNGWPRARLWLVAALVALFLAAAYTTLNRTVWLGFGLELALIIAALHWLRPRQAPPLSAAARATAAALALVLVGSAVAAAYAVHMQREATASVRDLKKDPRLALWSEAVERIEERPLTGYGFGRGMLRMSLREELGDLQLWHTHNLILDVAIQVGLPGLALLLALLAATLREAWRMGRSGEDLQIACGVALAAVVAGMLARNMTDMLWVRQNSLLYWGVVGTLLGWGATLRAPPSAR